jgi:signal transduction histidine kinase
LPERC